METCINYCEPSWAFMSSDERRWITHIRKLAEQKPDECIILKQPEENDGFIYAKFPPKWARIRPPRVIHMSDAEKARRVKNLQEFRSSRANTQDGDEDDE